jgi:hypothetical protein
MVCGFCGTGIEKTFRAQPEVKSLARLPKPNATTLMQFAR